ncbi:MAG TPA: hypothetical protein VFR34_07070, partial [Paracoccaceae bacterium]|nr:hypothetical protein [Paracoccaceae bacterium]
GFRGAGTEGVRPMRGFLAGAMALVAWPAAAQDFSAGSEAAEWGLLGEEKARFEAQVVDILCELAGDCPAECGGGARQPGLLRSDGMLVLPLKNLQPLFSGAATDLAPYCGKAVEVDGLLVGDPDQTQVKFYQIQKIREMASEEWQGTDRFTGAWAEANPDLAAKSGEWFRHDPRVKARIEAEGWFGLGLEKDAEILKEIFP